MLSTQTYLSQFGITMEQAKQFIMSNLNNLQYIADTCKAYGVTNDMIAEIYGQGVTGSQVESYFKFHGINVDLYTTVNFSTQWLSGETVYGIFNGYTTSSNKDRSLLTAVYEYKFAPNGTVTLDEIADWNGTFDDDNVTHAYSIKNNILMTTDFINPLDYSIVSGNRDGASIVIIERHTPTSPYVNFQTALFTTSLDVALSLLGTSIPENTWYPVNLDYPPQLEVAYGF